MAPPLSLYAVAEGDSVQLSWQNPSGTWSLFEVERDGSTIHQGNYGEGWQDNTVAEATDYTYKVRVGQYTMDGEYWSDWSDGADCTTQLAAPTSLQATAVSKTEIDLTWVDQSGAESSYKIYRNGTVIDTIAANSQSYPATGLSEGVEYTFKVSAYSATYGESFSNQVVKRTLSVPAAPSDLVATATGSTTISLSWKDNSSNETGFEIEESSTSPSSGFSLIYTTGPGVTSYIRTGRTTGTTYWYRVRAKNTDGNSDYTAVASATTFAVVAQPTALQVFAYKGTEVELTFADNSTLEDYHSIEMKIGAGSFTEVKQLEPNRTFCRIAAGIVAGDLVTIRVRAHEGTNDSSYSDEAAVTTPVAPSTPTGLAIAEQQDDYQILTWSAVSTAVGYVVYRSTNGSSFTEYLRIQRNDVLRLKVGGLTASTPYWYKISAYNGQAESSQSTAVTDTTEATYSEPKWEKQSRRQASTMIVLAEINPWFELTGWSLTGSQTYTYEAAVTERSSDLDGVYENGVSLTERTSIATVESNAGSWWHDPSVSKVYVHTSGGNSPSNYQIDGSLWLYFTNWRTDTDSVTFNDNNYLPLLSSSMVPDVQQDVNQFFDHSLSVTSGSIGLLNRLIAGSYFFDTRWRRYKWENRKVVLKAGFPGFAYADFKTVATGIVKGKSITDQKMQLDMADFRESAWREVPVSEFWTTQYANLDPQLEGQKRPFAYGSITGALAVLTDTVNKKYMFHDGRPHAVSNVYIDGVAVTIDTDCFIDYQRGIVEFDRDYVVEESDIVSVDFEGEQEVNGVEPIVVDGEVFSDFLTRFLGLQVADIDTDSVYYVKKQSGKTLAARLYQETSSDEVIKSIEQSCLSYSRQDRDGRVGLRLIESTVPSSARYIRSHQIKSCDVKNNWASLYKTVKVHYLENQYDKTWQTVTRSKPSIEYSYRVDEILNVYTYASSEADATTIADAFLTYFDKDETSLTVKGAQLFGVLAGDIVYVSRSRYPCSAGLIADKPMRVLSIANRLSVNEAALRLIEV